MGASKKFNLSDLSGGLNEGVDPTDIDDREFQALRNFYPWGKRLIKRSGITRITGPGLGATKISTSAAPYKVSTGTWELIVGSSSSIYRLRNSQLQEITRAGNLGAYETSLLPWSFAQYKDSLYCAREKVSTFQRYDGDILHNAGIAAPSTAPTIAEGSTGNLSAGNYIAVYTFVNSNNGTESNPSPPSSTLALAASKRIDWSGITTSGNAQVNARRLYRTLADQQGVYYLVDEISNNSTTSYVDNITETSLGIDASFDNGVPPVNLRYLAIFQERMWATDETDLWFSELLLPENFAEDSFIQVQPDDGHKIKGILSFGNKLIIGKTNKTWALVGTDRFELEVLGDHGCYSHHSMKVAEDSFYWFGGDNFYKSDGNAIVAIGDKKIRDTVDSIDLAHANKIISAVDIKKSWYITIVPANGATEANKVLVYNYKDDSWTIFDYLLQDSATFGSPTWIADFFTSAGKSVIYCNLDEPDAPVSPFEDLGAVFQFDTGLSDDGRDVTCSFRTKSFGYDKEDTAKIMRAIALQATVAPISSSVSLYKNEGVLSDVGVKTFSLEEPGLWKRVPLSNAGDPASSVALNFSAVTSQQLEILGMFFRIIDLEREVPIRTLS